MYWPQTSNIGEGIFSIYILSCVDTYQHTSRTVTTVDYNQRTTILIAQPNDLLIFYMYKGT